MLSYNMKTYYECHITFLSSELPARDKLSVDSCGWLYSRIDNDPDLGIGVKSYATRQFPADQDEGRVLMVMDEAVERLQKSGLRIIRQKLEKIIYDKRFKHAL